MPFLTLILACAPTLWAFAYDGTSSDCRPAQGRSERVEGIVEKDAKREYLRLVQVAPYYGHDVPQVANARARDIEARVLEDACDRLSLQLLSLAAVRGNDEWRVVVMGVNPHDQRAYEAEIGGEAWWVAARIEDWAVEAGVARPESPYVAIHRRVRAGSRGLN
jgi:hypothetical protein